MITINEATRLQPPSHRNPDDLKNQLAQAARENETRKPVKWEFVNGYP